MLRKLLYLCLFIIVLTGTFVCAQDKENNIINWQQVSDNNFIDPDGIVGTEDIYGFTFILKSYNKGQYEPINGREIQYTLSQYTIDCLKNRYKIGVIDSYDKFGHFVNGDYNKYAKFQPIVSGTAVGAVAKNLCKP